MATKKPTKNTKPSSGKSSGGKSGDVTFNYRSAKGIHGRVVGKAKGGSKGDPMEAVMPDKKDRHPGEKLPIHRRASKLHSA